MDDTYTVAGISFANSSNAQSYLLTGGKLILASATDQTSIAFGQIGAVGGVPHQIASDIEIHGTTSITVSSGGQSRTPSISGNITGNGIDPVNLRITGNGGNNSAVTLSGNNHFNGGEVTLDDRNSVRLGSENAIKGATLRLSGANGSANAKAVILTATTAGSQTLTYDFKEMIVEANGRINLTEFSLFANDTINWQSITITSEKKLEIFNGNNSTFRIAGAGKFVSLGTDADMALIHSRTNRFLRMEIADGALFEGSGTVSLSLAGTGSSLGFRIADGGILDPGVGTGHTGILHFTGSDPSVTASEALMMEGSTLRMQLNGLVAGTNYDQLSIDSGRFSLTTTGDGVTLSLSANYFYSESDVVTLINIADSGALFTGTFAGLAEGDLVEIGLPGGGSGFAQISYFGGSGNDVILHHFAIPEPGTWVLMTISLAGLFLFRRRLARKG